MLRCEQYQKQKLSVKGKKGLFLRVKFNEIRALLVSETWLLTFLKVKRNNNNMLLVSERKQQTPKKMHLLF
jgi:hypothetical protein